MSNNVQKENKECACNKKRKVVATIAVSVVLVLSLLVTILVAPRKNLDDVQVKETFSFADTDTVKDMIRARQNTNN